MLTTHLPKVYLNCKTLFTKINDSPHTYYLIIFLTSCPHPQRVFTQKQHDAYGGCDQKYTILQEQAEKEYNAHAKPHQPLKL